MVKPAQSAQICPASPSLRAAGVRKGRQWKLGRRHRHNRTWSRVLLQKLRQRLKKPVTGPAGEQGSGQGQGASSNSSMEEEGKLEDFLNTGRTGRRNAMPEIDDKVLASLTTADLPMDMSKLSCTESGSSSQSSEASKSASNQAS